MKPPSGSNVSDGGIVPQMRQTTMPTVSGGHPYFDLFTASLVPFMPKGPGHTQDPPSPDLLPLPAGSEEAGQLLDLLFGADHALRKDHGRVAAINLALAETRLRLTISHDGLTPMLEMVLSGILQAQEEMADGQPRRALSALDGALRAAQKQVPGACPKLA
jgi:hypothetical protein